MRLSQARAVLRHSRELAEALRERGAETGGVFHLTHSHRRDVVACGNSGATLRALYPPPPGHVALSIAVGVAPLRAAKINVEALID
jgi:hypothetical protein